MLLSAVQECRSLGINKRAFLRKDVFSMPSNIDRRGWMGEALPLVDQPPGTFIYPEPVDMFGVFSM